MPLGRTATELRAKRSNPGGRKVRRDSWIATSAFGLLAMTIPSKRSRLLKP
jgi:hypothetical protein